MKRRMTVVLFVLLVCVLGGCATIEQPMYNMGLCFEHYRSGLEYKTVEVDGKNIAYVEREGEGDTVVLLHGFRGDKDNWIYFVRDIPEDYRILAIDMPGHGDNDLDMDQTYEVKYFTHRMTRTFEELGLQRFHIAGNSFGGLVSTHYALNNPDKVITLGLFDSAGVFPPTPSELQGMLDKGDNPFFITSSEDFDRLMDMCFHDQPWFPWPAMSVLERRWIERQEFIKKMWNDFYDKMMKKDLTDRLAELKMPTFILWGDKDRILHVSSVEVYKRHLPDAHAVIMEDCGHVPMLERPDEAAEHYAGFLAQISGSN